MGPTARQKGRLGYHLIKKDLSIVVWWSKNTDWKGLYLWLNSFDKFLGPFFLLLIYQKDINMLYNNSIIAMPAMKDIILLEPSISGCDSHNCGSVFSYSLCIQEAVAILALPLTIITIYTLYRRRVKYLLTQNMSQTTMKMNQMLMKALTIHMGIIVVLLVIPLWVIYLIAIFGNEKYN